MDNINEVLEHILNVDSVENRLLNGGFLVPGGVYSVLDENYIFAQVDGGMFTFISLINGNRSHTPEVGTWAKHEDKNYVYCPGKAQQTTGYVGVAVLKD